MVDSSLVSGRDAGLHRDHIDPPTSPKQSSAADELEAARAAYDALRNLDSQSRYRVTGWLSSRLNSEQPDHDEEPF